MTTALSEPLHWAAIRSLYASVAHTVIVPLQDVLGLGNEARMNQPGSALGNWEWRFSRKETGAGLARRLHSLCETYERLLDGNAAEPI